MGFFGDLAGTALNTFTGGLGTTVLGGLGSMFGGGGSSEPSAPVYVPNSYGGISIGNSGNGHEWDKAYQFAQQFPNDPLSIQFMKDHAVAIAQLNMPSVTIGGGGVSTNGGNSGGSSNAGTINPWSGLIKIGLLIGAVVGAVFLIKKFK